jgi:hypothetical protein
MLVITIDLVPGGYESHRRTIGSMRIANTSNLADVSDYDVDAVEGANPLIGKPERNSTCKILAHDRRQSIWALLSRASAEILRVASTEL